MPTSSPGVLALEDGSIFRGLAFGAESTVTGEAVFNTSMTGYQEILTDPSYYGQIVTMTAVQIGNYGINPDDDESAGGPKVAGFVVRQLSPVASNPRRAGPMAWMRLRAAAGSVFVTGPKAGALPAAASRLRRVSTSQSVRLRISSGVSPLTTRPWFCIRTARGQSRPVAFR